MSVERIENWVLGRWGASAGKGVPLLNPCTEEVVAEADTSGIALSEALAFGRAEGGSALRALSFHARAELLAAMAERLVEQRETLIDSAVANGGNTRHDAKFDIDGATGTLAAYAEIGRSLPEGRFLADGEGVQLGRSPKFWGQHIYGPRPGIALLINAFNFPAWGFAEKAACALLAGMPIFVKPATATALTAYRVVRAIHDLVPPGVISFLGGPAHTLLEHVQVQDIVSFTGSAQTGRGMLEHPRVRSENVTVNVEADSLNAALLGPDAEPGSELFGLFCREVAHDFTQKAGQKCTAVRRIFVPAALKDAVAEALIERLAAIKIGDPALKDVRMGPLATQAQLSDVTRGVELLREETELLFRSGDERLGVTPGKGFFFPATLLAAREPAQAARIHTHEVFGPVATLVAYDGSSAAAIEGIRRGGGSLVASVYSDDRTFLEDVVGGIASHHGRLYLGSEKLVDQTFGPGTVLPASLHGGPGRAGGGEELGGLRGVFRFMQRTALQGYRPLIERISGVRAR